jgi:hypothetical protein
VRQEELGKELVSDQELYFMKFGCGRKNWGKTCFLERSARMLLKNQSPNRKDIGEELGSRTNLQREVTEQGLQNADHGGTRHVLDNSSCAPAPGTENNDPSA